jgi:nicotinamide riboside transporter PnuC
MLERISKNVDTAKFHISMVVSFLLIQVVGYHFFGLSFVQGWGGGIAASIATLFLVFKSQGYWAWMIVNASLWTYLFFHTGLPMLAYLQVSIIIFSIYGMIQWGMTKYRIGFTPKVRSDMLGAFLALGMFGWSIYAYRNMPGYTGTGWWWIEFASVLTSVCAIMMDAFKYKTNWFMWSLSNAFSFPLFLYLMLHNSAYQGPFWTIFIYQTINVIGFVQWYRDEKRLVAEGKVERVGGAQYA